MSDDPRRIAYGCAVASTAMQTGALRAESNVSLALAIGALAFMVIGCVQLADVKGHSKVWGFLGLFSWLGFIVVLLLPNRSAQVSPAYAPMASSPSSNPYAPVASGRTRTATPLWMVFLTVGSLLVAGFLLAYGGGKMDELHQAKEENKSLRAKMATDSALLEQLKSERETVLAEEKECKSALQKALRLLRRPTEQEAAPIRPEPTKNNQTPYLSRPQKLPATVEIKPKVLQAAPFQSKGFTAKAAAILEGENYVIEIQLTGTALRNVPGEVIMYAEGAEVMRKSFSGTVKPSTPLIFKASCYCANADQLKVVIFP